MQDRLIACPLWLVRLFPFIRWSNRINSGSIKSDLVAGLVGAIVVLPQGVAFAALAGLPPEYGLYAGMVPAIVAALWGSSWHLVSGPTTAASIVLFSTLSNLAEPGSVEYIRLVLTLTFMVGVIQFAMGLAKLGTLVNFISHSVIIGFTAGAAILICVNQLNNFFGIELAKGNFITILASFGQHVGDTNWYIFAVGLTTLLFGILSKRFLKKIPYMVVAMVAGSIVAVIINNIFGESQAGIATIGELPASLPPLSAPEFSLSAIQDLASIALAATLFALVEAVSIARSIGLKSGQHIDGNQEFIGQGLSNIAGSFFSAFVATGSFNRSGLNYEAGAKTPMAAVFAGVMLIIVVLLVAPWASYIPNAAMAAILFLVAWGLIDFYHIKKILQHSRSESSILLTTFFATLFLSLEFAILLGVLLSLALYLKRTSRPRIYSRVPNPGVERRNFTTDGTLPECPQLKLVRIDGSLFFGAISHIRETLAHFELENPKQKNLLLLSQGINFVDLAGIEFLEGEADRRHRKGGKIFFYRIKEGVFEDLNQSKLLDKIGDDHIFNSKTDALNTIVTKHLDHTICATCDKRIFKECASLPDRRSANKS